MSNPQISIVIPVYNTRQWIDEALRSVLSQSFTDYEIILINDFSTDGSKEICERYAKNHSFIKLINHPSNLGAGAARNAGLNISRGQYVYFFDSDDLLAEDALNRMFALCENKHLDLLFFGAEVLCSEKKLEYRVKDYEHYYKRLTDSFKLFSGPGVLQYMLESDSFIATPGLQFFRKAALTHVRYPEGTTYEDNAFTIKACLAAERAGMIPERLFIRRLRAESVMTSDKKYGEVEFINFQTAAEDILDAASSIQGNNEALRRSLEEFALVFCRDAFHAFHVLPSTPYHQNSDLEFITNRIPAVSPLLVIKLVEEMRAELYQTQENLAALENRTAELQNDLDHIRHSKSFRIGSFATAPLRLIRNAIGKLR